MSAIELFQARDARETEVWTTDAYDSRQESYQERKARQALVEEIIADRWPMKYPDGTTKIQAPVVENLAVSGIEDVMKTGGLVVPTLRCEAPTEAGATRALEREQAISYFWQLSGIPRKLPQWIRDAAKGLAAIKVWPDFKKPPEERFPCYEWVDPKTVIPPAGWVPGTEPTDVIISKMVKLRDLAKLFPDAAVELKSKALKAKPLQDTSEIEVVERYSDEDILCCAYIPQMDRKSGAVALYSTKNRVGRNPLILIGRDSADSNIRGQFDWMIGPMLQQNRIMTYASDYMHQAVYSPILKKNLNTPIKVGDAIMDLGADGEVTRLAPAHIDPAVWKMSADTERFARRAGVVPESRGGDAGASIISAAGVNALQGGFNSNTAYLQMIVADGLQRANEVAQLIDREYCDGRKSIAGLARGGKFRMTYTPSEIFKGGDIGNIVTYGAGAGLDAFNRTIRVIQLFGSGLVTKRWAMEQLEGIDNPLQMETQMFREQMTAILQQAALAKASQGETSALMALFEAVEKEGNILIAAQKVLEGMAETPEVQQIPGVDAAQQATSLQRGGVPGNEDNVLNFPPSRSLRVS